MKKTETDLGLKTFLISVIRNIKTEEDNVNVLIELVENVDVEW